MASLTEKIELQAMKYMAAKREKEAAELSMEQSKELLGELLRENESSEELVAFDDANDIKIKLSYRSRFALNKEKIAKRLRVEETAVNTEFIMKSIDKQNITFDQYCQHKEQNGRETISVRLVKVK